MITVKGDIRTISSGILVQGCNCHGVMGSGLAKHIRDKWPDVFKVYREHYDKVGLKLGEVVSLGSAEGAAVTKGKRHLHGTSAQLPPDVIVANAITQYDYGRDPNKVYVDYDAVTACFATIRLLARDTRLPVHVPLIGCGLANGKWEEVAPRIEAMLGKDTPTTLWLFD